MKLPLLAIAILLISCKDDSPEKNSFPGTIRREVQLDDSLGVIIFNSPVRYDTSFAWIHYSDCNTCHEHKYRFQSQKEPILKESGWLWEKPKDSIDRFTIWHNNYYFRTYDTDTLKDNAYHGRFDQESKFFSMKVIFDTIYKINDRYFSIMGMEKTDSISHKAVYAITHVNSNEVKFSCELMTANNDSTSRDFFKTAINLINSIVIINGPKQTTDRVGKVN